MKINLLPRFAINDEFGGIKRFIQIVKLKGIGSV